MNENHSLVYDILTSHKVFEDLAKFTLANGLREIKRVQAAKEELATRAAQKTTPSSDKGKGPVDDIELGDPGAEKAKLLQKESWNRAGSLEEAASSSPTRLRSGSESSEPNLARTAGPDAGPSSPLSEKARGKMRERRRSESTEFLNGNLDGVAASIGRNGFVATQEWVTSWQQGSVKEPFIFRLLDILFS